MVRSVSSLGNVPFPTPETPKGQSISAIAAREVPTFTAAADQIVKVIDLNYKIGQDEADAGDASARTAVFWSFFALVAAPAIGIYAWLIHGCSQGASFSNNSN